MHLDLFARFNLPAAKIPTMHHLTIWLAIGLSAGWITRLAVQGTPQYGILGDLTTGCLGAVIGGWLMRKTGVLAPDNLLGHVFTAMVGAFVLLTIIRGFWRVLPTVGRLSGPSPLRVTDLEARVRQSTELERGLLARFLSRDVSRTDPTQAFEIQLTFGQRLADKVASFGGSWTFIGLFFISMISWMVLNEDLSKPFDPFPFILLNLILSCLAAIQAPIIMMSQNRQSARDRIDARNDYEVNLRAELEIMSLHAKLDAARAEELAQLAAQMKEQADQLQRIEAHLVTKGGL